MQGTSLTKQERECKLYDEFNKFAYKKRETLRDFYLRFSLLLNDMNIYNMKLEQFQVNTKFLNTLPPEWRKFVTDVKLVWDLHTTNIDQLHAYLGSKWKQFGETKDCYLLQLQRGRTHEELAFLADSDIPEGQAVITHNATYQADDLDAYHSDCDKLNTAKVSLMANLSHCGLDALAEVHNHDNMNNNMLNQAVQVMPSSEQSNVMNHSETEITSDSNIIPYSQYVIESQQAAIQNSNSSAQQDALILSVIEQLKTQVVNCTKINLDNKSVNDTLTAELERYKEQVKVLKEGQNVDLRSNDNISDSCAQNINREIALEKRIKQLDNIVFKRDQSAQTVHMLTKPQFFYDHITKQALGFQNPFYLKKAQQLEPKLYDGNVIKNTSATVIPDSEETLILAEESCSKMLLKQKDPMMLEKKNYVNSPEPTLSSRHTKVEVPKELPKVSMVNMSLTKLKYHLDSFDMVVKERTIPTAITEGSWGFEHTKACFRDVIIPFAKALKDLFNTFDQYLIDELFEVQNVFHQMEQAVEQRRLESKTFEVKINQVLNKNEQLLEQVINKDIVNIIINSFVDIASVNMHECEKCLKLETELLNKNNFIEKKIYDKLFKSFTTLENHCISLEVDSQINQEIFQRDNSVSNQNAPSFDQLVSKLIAENEHFKHTYKQLYDSIKPARIRSKEQCDDLINQVNLKSVEISDLNASLQEKVLVITALKEDLRKLKGKAPIDNDEEATVLRDLVEHVKSKYSLDQSLEFAYRPTGQTFTIVGNACPLTRITTTTEVPLRKPTALNNETPKPVVTLVYSRKPRKSKTNVSVSKSKVIQIVLWYLDSGCSKHMTRDRSQLTNFVNKFLGTVKFRNDHVAKILGYGDYQIGNVTISRVYYVEGLGHNLFSVGQFCDSNLEVAFRQHTCFIRNLEGVDLLTGSRGNNLYTLSLGDMMASSPICLLSKASKTKSWLWHRRLSHLNFGAINHLARHGLVRGLPKLKFEKDHLCSACAMGKSKKKPHKPKSEDTNQEKLYLLHMDLCGPMRVASVNGKKYILVIVDDYSRFTWVKCLRSKDEAPDFIIKFLKMIQVRLKVPVRRIRTDNGTEFVNQTLREYYEKVGISHETSVARSPQQNGVIERRNCTLIEAAHTMLIYAKALLFLWAKAVATACYTQNHSIVRLRHGKIPYKLLHDKLPDLSFFHVFGALCYPTNDGENLGKLQPKADIGIFIGYAPTKKAFRIYNLRTRRIIRTIHVDFDKLTAMASEHSTSGPAYKVLLIPRCRNQQGGRSRYIHDRVHDLVLSLSSWLASFDFRPSLFLLGALFQPHGERDISSSFSMHHLSSQGEVLEE
ncbi:retrovirus-related pol polyprotein from transposon TNT 1-94 [Tanacetum coccineum]